MPPFLNTLENTPMKLRTFALAAAASAALTLPLMAQTTAPMSPSTPNNAPALTTDLFYTEVWTPNHWRATEAMGTAVYNRAGERIGEVDDVLVDGTGRVMAAVVGVGGFLGMGERKVAVTFRSFEMTREANGNPRLTVDLTKAALQAAPEYKPTAATRG
jgi:hypothetical protein